MPSVKSSTSHSFRFAPYEERAGGEASHPPPAEPEPGPTGNSYWEVPVAEEQVPYVAEEYEVECQVNDYQLDLPPLFEELSPQIEGAKSPSSSTESADSSYLDPREDPLGEPARGDEVVVEVDGEFEVNFDDSDSEDYIDDSPGAPQSPPPPLMYFGSEGCEETCSPDAGATTAAAHEFLRRVTRRLVFH